MQCFFPGAGQLITTYRVVPLNKSWRRQSLMNQRKRLRILGRLVENQRPLLHIIIIEEAFKKRIEGEDGLIILVLLWVSHLQKNRKSV